MKKRLRTTLVLDNLALPVGTSEQAARDIAVGIAERMGLVPLTVKAILATPTLAVDYWRVLVRVEPIQ